MNETLRPSTLGEILDRTVQLYRYNFWLFAGTAALPMVGAFVLAIPIVAIFAGLGVAGALAEATSVMRVVAFALAFIIFLPLYLGIYVFSIAGLTQATVSAHRGERTTIRAALKS